MSPLPLMTPPTGEAGIITAFGDPYSVMGSDGILSDKERAEWEKRLVRVLFPKPIPLSWAHGQLATRVTVHERIAHRFEAVFRSLHHDDELWRAVKSFGGGYVFRTKRSDGGQLSTHSWGIAIDLNVATNRMGTKGDMHPGIVQVFEAAGFTWGGRWRNPDPMHFQYAKAY